MNLQSDLFGDPAASIEPENVHPPRVVPAQRLLAMPCGFLDGSNKPCRRLGARPVIIDGDQLICRGTAMVHCEPDCFRSIANPVATYDDDDVQWDGSLEDAS